MRKKTQFQMLLIMLLDAVAIILAGSIAMFVRYDFSFRDIPQSVLDAWSRYLPIYIIGTILIYIPRKMYHYMWRSVTAKDAAQMLLSALLAWLCCFTLSLILGKPVSYSIEFVTMLCQICFHVGMRCTLRVYNAFIRSDKDRGGRTERIMIIGAGEAGKVILHEISTARQITGHVCAMIDDDPEKWGKYLEGVRIYGGRERIITLAERLNITQIILALPTASAKQRAEILDICKHTGCRIRTLPGIYQLVNGEASLAAVKDVQVEDLLNRDPVKLDFDQLRRFLENQTVLVTGGGGSIGSELCRQIAACRPKELIILDIYENTTYELQQQLIRAYGQGLHVSVEIASVREPEKIDRIFARYRPDLVFHAAAHKHVPLMENCPEEAIKNNVFGTFNVVEAAEKYGVKKFVMISTDKAVNPTNIMGASKRMGEMILQSRAGSKTEFASVRFGNVLGSNGSVIPLFKRQIEEGGPVTITDKRIIRYFMTISEAVQLVLEAGAIAKENQTFVLDMGEPVKILTMAENLIRLSGFVPYRTMEIQEIGLRPGEKLYEELLINSADLQTTANEKIFIDQQPPISRETIDAYLDRLHQAIENNVSREELIVLMKELVPTYRTPQEHNVVMAGS